MSDKQPNDLLAGSSHLTGPEFEKKAVSAIAHQRRARGLSYEQLARMVTAAGTPVNASALHRMEKGTPPRRLTLSDLIGIAQALQINPVAFLVDTDLFQENWALRTELTYCDVSAVNAYSSATNDYLERRRLLTRVEGLVASKLHPDIERLEDIVRARHHLGPERDVDAEAFQEMASASDSPMAEFRERRDAVLPELDRLIAELEAEAGD